MARSLGAELPAAIRERLGQADLGVMAGLVVPVITVDPRGLPHPMLCSYLELFAPDVRTIRLVLGAASRSAANLEARRAATFLLVEEADVFYVKGQAFGAPLADGPLVRFDLRVKDVLEDSAAGWEAGARITSAIRYGPPLSPAAPEAQRVLALLRQ
jgi:hypothetical protein